MATGSNTFPSFFGERLRVARKEAGLNQAEMAAWAEVSRDTLGRYERGEITPSAEVLAKIVQRLSDRFDADWLLFGKKEDVQVSTPIFLDEFGALTRLIFQQAPKPGGKADVSLGPGEVIRFLEGVLAYVLRKEEPNKEIVSNILQLIEYLGEEEPGELEMVARVVLARQAVRLLPEWPEENHEEFQEGADEVTFVEERAQDLLRKGEGSEEGD